MHHLSVNTGGRGGRQVNGSPPRVFDYAFRGGTCGMASVITPIGLSLWRYLFCQS